jgi:MoxR-like ATPase
MPDDDTPTPARPRRTARSTKPARSPRDAVLDLRDEVAKVVVGQEGAMSGLVAALLVRGHVLLEGVPGVAKTLLVKTIAAALDLDFKRVQFTPDLMPSDVIGQTIFEARGSGFRFREGPVFCNLLLADEINRTPPKTQAALLEAMQEGQVSVEGGREPLPDPFLVVATQNPIEYEGTYPLPEAQVDRFLVRLRIGYPAREDEERMLSLARRGVGQGDLDSVTAVAGADGLRAAREEVDATRVGEEVAAYVVAVVRRTRDLPSVTLGASPRAAVHLLGAARAAARLAGRDFVTPDDVVRMAPAVLAHRLLLTPEAELERYTPDDAVRTALAEVPVPR